MKLSAVGSLMAALFLGGNTFAQETKNAAESSPSSASGATDKMNVYVDQLKIGTVRNRTGAAYALSGFGVKAKAAVPVLREVLKERDPELRFAAAWALWEINRESTAVDAFTELLTYKAWNARNRAGAANVLGSFGVKAKAAVPALREVLKEGDPELRIAAAKALWRINKDSTAVAAFTELVTYKADCPLPVTRGS